MLSAHTRLFIFMVRHPALLPVVIRPNAKSLTTVSTAQFKSLLRHWTPRRPEKISRHMTWSINLLGPLFRLEGRPRKHIVNLCRAILSHCFHASLPNLLQVAGITSTQRQMQWHHFKITGLSACERPVSALKRINYSRVVSPCPFERVSESR